MEVAVVYSIGERCYTEKILKRLNLIKFSSIFGSMNMKNYNNVIRCFDTNCKALFDPANLICTKNVPQMGYLNKEHGFRTLNRLFDVPTNFHSATIAHHDLSTEKDQEHFKRGLQRLEYIKEKELPVLFVHISMDFNNTHPNPALISSILAGGFKHMKVLSIYKTETPVAKPKLLHESTNHIIYKMHTDGYNDPREDSIIEAILLKHFKFSKLLTLDDFPKIDTPSIE